MWFCVKIMDGNTPGNKENIWLKQEKGEYDEEKYHVICYLNFHGLLGNLSAVVCVYINLCVSVKLGRGWTG